VHDNRAANKELRKIARPDVMNCFYSQLSWPGVCDSTGSRNLPILPKCITKFRFPLGSDRYTIVTIRLTASGGSGHASGLFAPRHKRLLGAPLREEVECRERVKRRPGVELSARLVAGGGLGPTCGN